MRVATVPTKWFYSITAIAFISLFILFGIAGGFFEAMVAAVIASVITRQMAKSRRRKLSDFTLDELIDQRKVSDNIPWSAVKAASMIKTNLLIRTDKKTFRMILNPSEVEAFKTFMQSKIGDNLKAAQ